MRIQISDWTRVSYSLTLGKHFMNRPWLITIAIPLGLALNPASGQAESPRGALHGITANSDGTAIPSAVVVIRRMVDNTDLTIISGFDGSFSASNLVPGQYQVKASKGELRSSPATVGVGAQQDLNISLALAA